MGHSLRHGRFEIMVGKTLEVKQVATLNGGSISLNKLKCIHTIIIIQVIIIIYSDL